MKQLNIIISGHYFPGFQAQRYMFRLMTLSFFFLAANRALIHLIEGETPFFFAQVAIS